jgi:hypothetical protein
MPEPKLDTPPSGNLKIHAEHFRKVVRRIECIKPIAGDNITYYGIFNPRPETYGKNYPTAVATLSFIINKMFSYNTKSKYEHEEAARPD